VIVGVGIDLVEVDRIAGMHERHGDTFANRVLHPAESRHRLANADGPTHLAGLFAVKEAVMKALGTGMSGARFSEIRVHHSDAGQPSVELTGTTLANAEALGIRAWHVSITHTKTAAAAVAIALST